MIKRATFLRSCNDIITNEHGYLFIHLLIKPIREDRLTDANNRTCDKYQRTISDEGKCLDMINEQIICGIS